MNTLDILPTNKTLVFYSPLEGNDCLVRTGTEDGELISFFNSVLLACSRSFKNMDKKERHALIKKIQGTIQDKINTKFWKIQGIELFKDILQTTLIDFYKAINISDISNSGIVKRILKKVITTKKQFELFKIITDLLPYDVITKIYPENNNIQLFKKSIMNTVKNYLINLEILHEIDDEKADDIIKNIVSFTKLLMDEVECYAYSKFEYNVEKVDDILVNIVSDYFNCNIYFINSVSRTPYILNDFDKLTNINSIIVLGIQTDNRYHYEIVGKLTHGNIINRDFMSDDLLIKKINSLLTIQLKKQAGYEAEHIQDLMSVHESENMTTSTDTYITNKDETDDYNKENIIKTKNNETPDEAVDNITDNKSNVENEDDLDNSNNILQNGISKYKHDSGHDSNLDSDDQFNYEHKADSNFQCVTDDKSEINLEYDDY